MWSITHTGVRRFHSSISSCSPALYSSRHTSSVAVSFSRCWRFGYRRNWKVFLAMVLFPGYSWSMVLSSDIRHGKHCMFQLHVHLVFVTRYSYRIFNEDAINCLRAIFTNVCNDFASPLVERDGEDNHVHLLVNYPRKHSVSALVNSLKGVSSRLLRLERPDPRAAIEKAFCGRRRTSLPVAAVRRSVFSRRASNSKRHRSSSSGGLISPPLKGGVLRPHG